MRSYEMLLTRLQWKGTTILIANVWQGEVKEGMQGIWAMTGVVLKNVVIMTSVEALMTMPVVDGHKASAAREFFLEEM